MSYYESKRPTPLAVLCKSCSWEGSYSALVRDMATEFIEDKNYLSCPSCWEHLIFCKEDGSEVLLDAAVVLEYLHDKINAVS